MRCLWSDAEERCLWSAATTTLLLNCNIISSQTALFLLLIVIKGLYTGVARNFNWGGGQNGKKLKN